MMRWRKACHGVWTLASVVAASTLGCASMSSVVVREAKPVVASIDDSELATVRSVAHTADASLRRQPGSSAPKDGRSEAPQGSPVTTAPPLPPPPLEAAFDGVPIDLITALAMTDGQNPQVAFARERINEAYSQLRRANVLWLPSLRGGFNYNKHEGQIQDVAGHIITTSRGSLYTGLGANAVGAGSPSIPGVMANFHLTDAIFQPRIAQSVVCARHSAADANTNDALLQTALAYVELLRAEQERTIAREAADNVRELASLTTAYANAGQGLQADDDRSQTELALRESDLLRADEGVAVTSARLAQQLRLDPSLPIQPTEPIVVPLDLLQREAPVAELVATGLAQRPEVAESRYLVNEAIFRLRREQFAPLIPSVLLGVSYGGLGGGKGSQIENFGDRFDGDAIAYWELRNFGLGEGAARGEAASRVSQARLREMAALDRVAREIVEAHTQVGIRAKQIAIAERGIQHALASYQRNLERIQNAQGLPLEVLQSIQALAAARREYLRVVSDHNAAQFQLLRAIGGTPHEALATPAPGT